MEPGGRMDDLVQLTKSKLDVGTLAHCSFWFMSSDESFSTRRAIVLWLCLVDQVHHGDDAGGCSVIVGMVHEPKWCSWPIDTLPPWVVEFFALAPALQSHHIAWHPSKWTMTNAPFGQ